MSAVPTLVGQCNRCGLCCTRDGYVCVNLVVHGKLGEPNATHCRVYHLRHPGMKVTGINAAGEKRIGNCEVPGAPGETLGIIPYIGKGCSLRIKEIK